MGHAVRIADRSQPNAGRCLASLAFVILLATAFWSGVLWLAALAIHLGGGFAS
jgi:hypothetical protein